MAYLRAALDLYEVTADPLVLDAVRAMSTPETPEMVVKSAENYVETQYDRYLNLFRNSDKHQLHDYGLPRPTDPADLGE